MGKVKENDNFEWHSVQCARCVKKETIRVPLGRICQDLRFTTIHEYLCPPCFKMHDPNKGAYTERGKGKKWTQATVPKSKSLRDQIRETFS